MPWTLDTDCGYKGRSYPSLSAFFRFFLSITMLRHLFLLFIVVASTCSTAEFFVWPSDWVVVNNASLPSIYTSSGFFHAMDGPFRSIVAASGVPMFSENGTYAFGFIQLNSTGDFLLCVALDVVFRTPPGTAVWVANANQPVKENASLRIGPSGNMVLLDWDGTEVWNSGQGSVRAVAMQPYGDLQFFNTTNSSEAHDPVWRSWISPTQRVLVLGQTLPTGSKLVSNISATNSSEGIYRLVIEPAGMILYTGEGFALQPYWDSGFPGFDDFDSIRQPCFLNASSADHTSSLYYSGDTLSLPYGGDEENGTTLCPPVNRSSSASIMTFGSINADGDRFLRLDADGNLRGYLMDFVTGQGSTREWAVNYELFRTGTEAECRLPNVCGPYGVCRSGQCSCPGSGSTDAFAQASTLNSKAGCVPPRPLLCNITSIDHHFLELKDVDYFLNSFSTPEANVSTLEQCKSLCSSNCSCEAFFFHGNSSSCFQAKDLRSLLFVSGSNFMAYLKVQNAPVPTSSSTGESNTLSKGSIAGIAIGTAVAVFLLLALLIVRLKKADGPVFLDPDEEEERAFLEALPGLPPRFTLKELRVATKEFKQQLGAGGFGAVYEGVLKDGSKVAVKRLNGARQGHKEFRAEVATIGSINHVNLVRLRGFCAEKGERLLIYELVENGSLDQWIFRDRTEDELLTGEERHALSWERRLSIAIGTAKGLAYLHEDCREAILHLDIKPQNILLNENFVPKVADFGMARLMEGDMTEVVTAVRGTPGYLAPEWLRASIATKKCDVYSFGMLLLELIGGRKNFDPTLGSDPSFYYFPTWAKLRALEGKYMDLLDERLKRSIKVDEKQQEEEIERVSKVAFCCIHEDPRMRPTIGAVVSMLEGHESNIPTLAALGLSVREGGFTELTQGPSWALLFSESSTSSMFTNETLSGPR